MDLDAINFVRNEELTTDEQDVTTVQWTKPVDSDGLYDPNVELELWQFMKLPIRDQVDYLLMASHNVMHKCKLRMIDMEFEVPCSGTTGSFQLNRNGLHPRESPAPEMLKIAEQIRQENAALDPDDKPRRGPANKWSGGNKKGWYNYDKYMYTTLSFYDGERHHHVYTCSTMYATTIIYMLVNFLIKMAADKYNLLEPVLEYYETALIMVDKPRKFKNV
jgi:hypothetical protein